MFDPLDLWRVDPRLRQILHDQTPDQPSAANRAAVARLVELPTHLIDLLLAHGTVRTIYIGAGPVPDLDEMGRLRGQPVREERPDVLWDDTVAAFRSGMLLLGDLPDRPSVTCDVPAHEIGHAICVADDLACYRDDFPALYRACQPVLCSPWDDRDEFYAEVWASVFVGNGDWLTSIVGGRMDLAEQLWVWFAMRYQLR